MIAEDDTGNFFAFVPARSGSVGVAHKNMALWEGFPLLAYAVAAASFFVPLDRVVVSTDSPRYAELALEMGASVPGLRPVELSGSLTSDLEVFLNVLRNVSSAVGEERNWLHLRPSTPDRTPDEIRAAISAFLAHPEATSLRSYQRHDSGVRKLVSPDPAGFLETLSGDPDMDRVNVPRQLLLPVGKCNGIVDILRESSVRMTGAFHGNKCLGFLTRQGIDVDQWDDLQALRQVQPNSAVIERVRDLLPLRSSESAK